MEVLTESHPDRPELDMRRSQQLLEEVAAGTRAAVARVYRR